MSPILKNLNNVDERKKKQKDGKHVNGNYIQVTFIFFFIFLCRF